MSVQVERHHFTVDEYYRMGDAGIFTEDDRVELIDGEIIRISPIGSRHAACVRRLDALLNRLFSRVAQVSAQNPIRISDFSEPQPDIALLSPRADFYAQGHPTPANVLLVIEVADTSVEYDREIKGPLYARAGIAEMWLVNLREDLVELYTNPAGGSYQSVRRAGRSESFTSQSLPGMTFSADEILG